MGLDTFNCELGVVVVKCSVMVEDAEEAAKKLNKKEFFGKIVTAEIAKPKRHENIQPFPTEPRPLTEAKREEKEVRLHTIVVFGIPRHMNIDTLRHKLDPIINKNKLDSKSKSKPKSRSKSKSKSDSESENRLEWPCPAPFTTDNLSYGYETVENHPVAHVIVAEANMPSIKEVLIVIRSFIKMVREIDALPGFFARRLSTIPANRVNFEKCRMIVRNIPFKVGSARRVHHRSATRDCTICSAGARRSTASRCLAARTETRRATASCSCSATAMWRRWWGR